MLRHLAGLFCAVFLIFGLGPAVANAAANRWTNPLGGNWNVAGNWSGGIPVATDTAVIDLAGTYTVTMNVNPTIAALRISGAASGVQTVTGSSRTFALPNASSIGAQGVLQLSSSTVTGAGAITNEGTLQLSGTYAPPISNLGTLTVTAGTATLNGAITNASGATLRVNSAAAAAFTIANGFTNDGTIELTSTANAPATLTVSAGTLTNNASISVLAGGGGARTLAAQLNNAGTLTIGANTSTSVSGADHANTGMIDVSGGNWTVTLSGTTPTFTMTSGAINVASGRTLNLNGNISGGTGLFYNFNGGTLGGAGTVSMTSSTLVLNAALATSSALLDPMTATINGPGTLTVSTGTTLTATSSTINAPTVVESGGTLALVSSDMLGSLTNSGTVTSTGASTTSGSITTQSGSVIRVFNGTLTVANGFTNSAAIELTALSGATTAGLTVTWPGTLTNSASGTISVLAGTGGSRTLHSQLANAGTITVGANLSTSVASADHVNSGTIDVSGGNWTVTLSGTTPTFTMSGGAIDVASGRTLNLNGTTPTGQLYQLNGGTLGGAGTVSVNNSTLVLNIPLNTASTNLDPGSCVINGPSTLTVSAGTTLNPVSSTINAPVAVAFGATLDLNTTSLNGAVTNGGTWLVRGVCPIGSPNITTDANSVIRVQGNGATLGWMQVSTGFTNDAAIELTSVTASGQARLDVTSGTLVNTTYATIRSLVGAGGARVLNANLINVGTITVDQPMTTVMTPANHQNTGTIDLTTGNWTMTMGGLTGNLANTGIINIPVGRTLSWNGAVNGGAGLNYNLNSGTNISGGGILAVNNATLKLNIPYSTSWADLVTDAATIAGDTLRITAGDSAHVIDTTTVSAPLVIEAGGKFLLNTSFITGHVRNAGWLEVMGFCTSGSDFHSLGGSLLSVVGIGATTGRFRFPSGFTNHGVLDMSSRAGAVTAILETTAGTIANSATGTINVEPGAGGQRQILAPFTNAGQLNIRANLTVLEGGAAHSNSGTVSIDATRALTVSGATFTNQATGVLQGSGALHLSLSTFAQEGKLTPGTSPGVLSIIRPGTPLVFPISSAPTASLDVEVGGDVPGTGHDQVIYEDPVALAGTLNLSVINGYQPRPGHRYVIATFPSRTGTFATVNGLDYNVGQMWAVAYSDTDVVLLAMDQTWSRAIPDGPRPTARDGHAAAYDPAGDRMMVFGGQTDADVMNDTWVLSKAVGFNYPAWAQLATIGAAPSQRRDATAVYAAASNRLIVFGGADGAGTTVFGDVRVLTNANGVGGTATWSALSPTGTPPSARSNHAAAYDAANDRMIVMGGDTTPDACGGELADVWVLSNASGFSGTPAWTQLSPTGTPPTVRSHHGAAYDAATGRLIVVGGDACGADNTETWTLSDANGLGGTPAWTLLAPAQPTPANWSLARYAYDESYGWLDAFGGKVGATLVDTAFTLTNAQGSGSPNWYRRLFYGDRPAPRSFHSMILSSATHTAVVFGGMTASGRVNDVWRRVLDKGPVLDVEPPPVFVPTHTAFALPPSPNPAHGPISMAVDAARDQDVDLAVFDLAGRRVVTLHSGRLPAGRHHFEWGARRAAPGVYLVRMKAEERTQTVRVVRI